MDNGFKHIKVKEIFDFSQEMLSTTPNFTNPLLKFSTI